MYKLDMLGGFEISTTKNKLNIEIFRSDMLVKLLSFLIIHRERALYIQDLSNALWQDDETDNPAGALKNLMYRLRLILKKVFGNHEFIITNRGTYQWNCEIEIILDFEVFEEKCKNAKKAGNLGDFAKETKLYEEAIVLYKGGFLAKYSEVHWIVPLASYFHSLFLSSVKNLAQTYMNTGKYEEIEQVCTKALKIEMVDERMYIYIIKSLILQNKRILAIEYYNKAEKILYTSLGIQKTQAMCSVHKELLEMQIFEQTKDIQEIHNDIVKDDIHGEVFVCGFEIFKELYKIEARKIKRLGIEIYVILFSIELINVTDNVKINVLKKEKAMEKLLNITRNSLRSGDVISKYSNTQLIILLTECNYENCLIITERISKTFGSSIGENLVKIYSNIEAVVEFIPLKKMYVIYE